MNGCLLFTPMCPILDNKLNFYSIHSCLPPSIAKRLQKGIQWMSKGNRRNATHNFTEEIEAQKPNNLLKFTQLVGDSSVENRYYKAT